MGLLALAGPPNWDLQVSFKQNESLCDVNDSRTDNMSRAGGTFLAANIVFAATVTARV